MRKILPVLLVVMVVLGTFFYIKDRVTKSQPQATIVITDEEQQLPLLPKYKILDSAKVSDVAPEFLFSAEIPTSFKAEAIVADESINIFDPDAKGTTTIEQSQIFIRYFVATQFLTLSTVNILESDEIIVNGRPAIRYVIEKKADITNFPNQPSFRNKKHSLTDIRVSDGSPSMFYVIAKNPELDDEIYMHLLETLSLQN